MTIRLLLACALLLIAPGRLFAQSGSVSLSSTAVTVTGTSTQVGSAHTRRHLELINQSTLDTIYCKLDGTAAVATATAGQLTFLPSGVGGFSWTTGMIPSNAINCISSGSSTPLTIIE